MPTVGQARGQARTASTRRWVSFESDHWFAAATGALRVLEWSPHDRLEATIGGLGTAGRTRAQRVMTVSTVFLRVYFLVVVPLILFGIAALRGQG